jgi:hypothetical protein
VLTRSDKFTRRGCLVERAERSAVLRRAIEKVIGDRAQLIPFVPLTNARRRNPDRTLWMTSLWVVMLSRMSQHGFDAFVLSTTSRVTGEETSEEEESPPRPVIQAPPAPSAQRRSPPLGQAATARPWAPKAGRSTVWPTQAAAAPQAASRLPRPQSRAAAPPLSNPAIASERSVGWNTQPTTTSYESTGVPVIEKVVNVGRGTGDITLSAQHINNARIVIESRGSSDLLGALRVVGSWIASRVRHLFGW